MDSSDETATPSTPTNPSQIPTNTTTPPTVSSLPPAALDLATRLFDSARLGDPDSTLTTLLTTSASQSPPRPFPINLRNSSGNTLLMLASYHGHLALTRLLLRHGADVNLCNDRGQSPLAGTIFKGEREVAVCLVEEGGADPRVGSPSALECVELFRQEWLRGRLEEAVRRLEEEERGEDVRKNGEGVRLDGEGVSSNGEGTTEP